MKNNIQNIVTVPPADQPKKIDEQLKVLNDKKDALKAQQVPGQEPTQEQKVVDAQIQQLQALRNPSPASPTSSSQVPPPPLVHVTGISPAEQSSDIARQIHNLEQKKDALNKSTPPGVAPSQEQKNIESQLKQLQDMKDNIAPLLNTPSPVQQQKKIDDEIAVLQAKKDYLQAASDRAGVPPSEEQKQVDNQIQHLKTLKNNIVPASVPLKATTPSEQQQLIDEELKYLQNKQNDLSSNQAPGQPLTPEQKAIQKDIDTLQAMKNNIQNIVTVPPADQPKKIDEQLKVLNDKKDALKAQQVPGQEPTQEQKVVDAQIQQLQALRNPSPASPTSSSQVPPPPLVHVTGISPAEQSSDIARQIHNLVLLLPLHHLKYHHHR
jgi:hypothetical protein